DPSNLPDDLRAQATHVGPILQDQPGAAGAQREIDDRQSKPASPCALVAAPEKPVCDQRDLVVRNTRTLVVDGDSQCLGISLRRPTNVPWLRHVAGSVLMQSANRHYQ